MIALGFRADPTTLHWAVIDGPADPLKLLGCGGLESPVSFNEAQSLTWFRNEVETLLAEHRPDVAAIRYAETVPQRGGGSSAYKRARIEGVVLEICNRNGLTILTAQSQSIKSKLKADHPIKAYVSHNEFRGLDWSTVKNKLRREAIVVAAASLGEICE
jgi:Holliday junction resolvasome RuvABC endonuclease subunit